MKRRTIIIISSAIVLATVIWWFFPWDPIYVPVDPTHGRSWSTDTIAAVFIAACALFVSVWSAYQTRKHNRLLVRPNLETHFMRSEPTSYIAIFNSGLGPAILTSLAIRLGDYEFDGTELLEWNKFHKHLETKLAFSSGVISKGTIIGAGQKYPIIWLDEEFIEFEDKYFLYFDEVIIHFNYKSIYGEPFSG